MSDIEVLARHITGGEELNATLVLLWRQIETLTVSRTSGE